VEALRASAGQAELPWKMLRRTYCVNLERRPERWSFMQRQFADLQMPCCRWSAVDGRAVDAHALAKGGLINPKALLRYSLPDEQKLFGIDLTDGSIGCALSHMEIWKDIIETTHDDSGYFLVVEDDCSFRPGFSEALLQERLSKVPSDWQIVFLGGQCSVVAAMVYGFLAAASDAQKVVPMACTTTLWLLYFASLLGAVDDNNHPEEDLALGINEQKRRAASDKRAEGPTRMDRIAANQMESFPMALIVLWAAYILNAEKTYLAAMFITYTVLRIFFVICYLFALSPLRTIVFLLGQLTIVAVIILGFLGTEKVHLGGGWHADEKSGY